MHPLQCLAWCCSISVRVSCRIVSRVACSADRDDRGSICAVQWRCGGNAAAEEGKAGGGRGVVPCDQGDEALPCEMSASQCVPCRWCGDLTGGCASYYAYGGSSTSSSRSNGRSISPVRACVRACVKACGVVPPGLTLPSTWRICLTTQRCRASVGSLWRRWLSQAPR